MNDQVDHKAEVNAAAVRFAARVEALLEEVPGWPQPADPFGSIPSAERATCDGDFVL